MEMQEKYDVATGYENLFAGYVPFTHDLKIWPDFFGPVEDRTKTFEVRRNDRNFQIGDYLCLREWWDGHYTGRFLYMEITYVLPGGLFGVEAGYVVMGIAPMDE